MVGIGGLWTFIVVRRGVETIALFWPGPVKGEGVTRGGAQASLATRE